MEVKDIIKKREILEKDILKYLDVRLNEFLNETSLSPSNIYVSLSEVYLIGNPIPVRIIVEKVKVDIQL